MRKPSLLLLAPYAFHLHSTSTLDEAHRLTEYDVIAFLPSPAGLEGSGADASQRLKQAEFDRLAGRLRERRSELSEFLDAGGVLAVLLRELGWYVSDREETLLALELLLSRPEVRRMGFELKTGVSLEILDSDEVMSDYLRQVREWRVSFDSGVMAKDPHGYPLAVSRDRRAVAYVEHVGAGTVYWLPYPTTDGDWKRLLSGLADSWTDRFDPLSGLASEALTAVQAEIDRAQQESRRQVKELRDKSQAILAARRQLLEADAHVARALGHYRAAQHASPAKALDFLHRMVETIEYVYGGEAKAISELGYSKTTLSDVTRPANHKPYRARHEGGQGETVPEEVSLRAVNAADEILGRFLERRQRDLQEDGAGPQRGR